MTLDDTKIRKDHPVWKCGKCGKEYCFNEFMELMSANCESGRMPTCPCGYVFLCNRWKLQDVLRVKINDKEIKVLVSTVFLELNHGFLGRDLWYETMVFVMSLEKDVQDRCIGRYETEEQATEGHNKTLELIKSGNYDMILKGEI